MNRIVTIVIGVLVLLGIFAAAIYFLDSPTTKVEPKNKVETVKKVSPSIRKQLDNHEKEIQAGKKKDKEQDFRLNKHAEAISDLEQRLNELKTDSSSTRSDSSSEKKSKIRKYTKGWDFKDFPENW
ncbi:hypothetical protein C4565_07450 [Candidatus Parcubacteria bacterium]|jgi:septal ring factor EnvC (AmiA/AmiB activator)|nr:MAG: hypothetical protein C4565_07450 [Candidatus Parcubacteria bacterium]